MLCYVFPRAPPGAACMCVCVCAPVFECKGEKDRGIVGGKVRPCSVACFMTHCLLVRSPRRLHTCLLQTCDSAGPTHSLHTHCWSRRVNLSSQFSEQMYTTAVPNQSSQIQIYRNIAQRRTVTSITVRQNLLLGFFSMSSSLYTRPCCNIKTCSLWQANVTVSVSRSKAMLRCQTLCSLQALAAWAPSVAFTNLQQFRSGPRPTRRINAHNLNWLSVCAAAKRRERNVGSACRTWHSRVTTFSFTTCRYRQPRQSHGGRRKRNPEALRWRMRMH
ncbi:hypothetical protein Baya_4633 [Bagarius yarrelli]|uniref:Uncharacterized protein n=1 Tax=Bagarius yarrelli TaxID=175774 RepID=A0A556TRA8_BAGYA|nr:hypothetical protein Baya_4633 [Bagarius yarrelli]